MDKTVLKAEVRKITGRKVKTLRREGILPANVYGKKVKSLAVSVNANEFKKVYKEVGETGLVELTTGKEKRPVLIHSVQVDPVSDAYLHADFLQVDLKEKVTAQVPVELTGDSPAEKAGLGTVVQHVNEVTVEALPADLPEKFVIDISSLTEVDQQVTLKDLSYDKAKVEVTGDPEIILVKVEPPQKEEVVAAPAAAEAPVAAEGEVPAEEGKEGEATVEEQKNEKETPAEG